MRFLLLVGLFLSFTLNAQIDVVKDIGVYLSINNSFTSKNIKLNNQLENHFLDYDFVQLPDVGIGFNYPINKKMKVGLGIRYRYTKTNAIVTLNGPRIKPLAVIETSWDTEYLSIEPSFLYSINDKNNVKLRMSLNDPLANSKNRRFNITNSFLLDVSFVELEAFLLYFEREFNPTAGFESNTYLSIEYGRELFDFLEVVAGLEKNILLKRKEYNFYLSDDRNTGDLIQINTDFFSAYIGVRLNLGSKK